VNGAPDWEAYLTTVETSGLAVLGVTDYFTIDGYKMLRQFQLQGRLPSITLLPNIELRLDKIVASKKDGEQPRRLNFHVFFSEMVDPAEIEEHFLHDIYFNYQGTPGDKNEQRKLKPSNLEELGSRLISEHPPFKGNAPLVVGAMNAVVNLDHVVEILTKTHRFKDKYLLVLADQYTNLIPWDSQDHHTRKTLLQQTDMILTGNTSTVDWCLGRSPSNNSADSFIKEFGTLKPCIWGSDAHHLEAIGRPCARRGDQGHACSSDPPACELRHCWIKADPTFEGLRQLLYEPADRVRIQPDDPTPSKSIYCLSRLSVPAATINNELKIAATDVPLNAGLVAVTGGRGSGKTAFVDILAHCFVNRQFTDDRNSFVRRISEDSADLSMAIAFSGGETFGKVLSDGTFFEDSGIAYIAQGELERYIDEHSDLNEYIHSVVFESPAVKDSSDAFEYESLVQATESLQADLNAKNARIYELECATAPHILENLKKLGKQARADSEDLKKRILDAESKLSVEKRKLTKQKQEVVAALKKRREDLVAVRDLLREAMRSLDLDLTKVVQTIRGLNALVAQLGIGAPVAEPLYPDRTRLDELLFIAEKNAREVVASIERNEKEIKSLAEEMREHAKLLTKQQEADTKYKDLQNQWRVLQEQLGVLQEEKRQRTELYRKLLTSVTDQRAQYVKIIQTFGAAKDEVLSDLDFNAELRIDSDSLLSSAAELVDNRQVEVAGTEKEPSVFTELLDLFKKVASGDPTAMDAAVAEIDKLAEHLRLRLKKARSVTTLTLYSTLYHSYLSVRPTALYKRTSLDRLSLGQKATVLIKIYLAEGDKPIIIDSHDDHLDNEFIMEELVGSIREARNYRQVIIASNNGNVVVNSDADQVIVAQRKGGEISYIAGAIEDPLIRERALKVLEGGYDAFRKRQQKYRISSIQ
jgi:predicted nuclease with TOPRIM domain